MPMPFAQAWRRWCAGAALRRAPMVGAAAVSENADEVVHSGADAAPASTDAADELAALPDSSDFFQRLTGDCCVA